MKTSLNVCGIILCAGFSSRMNGFKPLLRNGDGETFIHGIIKKLNLFCSSLTVVTGFKNEEIIKEISSMDEYKKCNIVLNENFAEGMFSSLKISLLNSSADWYLYHFVDQPDLPIEFYKKFIYEIDNDYDWIQPINKGHKGHPILFNNTVKDLIQFGKENNLRTVSRHPSIRKKFVEFSSELIFQDIDTIDDYKSYRNG